MYTHGCIWLCVCVFVYLCSLVGREEKKKKKTSGRRVDCSFIIHCWRPRPIIRLIRLYLAEKPWGSARLLKVNKKHSQTAQVLFKAFAHTLMRSKKKWCLSQCTIVLWENYVRRCMASQKMCFPETVIIVQHFLVSVTVSSVVGLFSALCVCACVCVYLHVQEPVWVCSPLDFPHFYMNVREALDISKRNHSFSKTIPHHAPEPQWDEKITSSTSQILSGRFSTELFM